MKIVHVEDFIHPDAGYQVNLLSRLQRAEGHQVAIVTGEMEKMPSVLTEFFGKDDMEGRDQRFARETGVPIYRVPLHGFYSGRAIFHMASLFRRVNSLKPDVVFVHNEDTLTGILFILFSRWLRYPIVLDCHMLEMASVNRFRHVFRYVYRKLITPIILRRKIPLIRVVDSDYVEKCLGIPLGRTDLLSFGTDTSYFSPSSEERKRVRNELGVDETTFLVLYAGKMDESKGGKFLAESLEKHFETLNGRKLEFLIIGNTEGEYGRAVETKFKSSANRIIRVPTQRYYDLVKYYQAADLAVFPRQCSMSFFEAQSCGLPILFEDNEVNRDRCTLNNAVLFNPNDIDDFRKKIAWFADLDRCQIDELREKAREFVIQEYDYLPIAKRFTAVLRRAIEDWRHAKP